MQTGNEHFDSVIRSAAIVMASQVKTVLALSPDPQTRQALVHVLNQRVNYLLIGTSEIIDDATLTKVIPDEEVIESDTPAVHE